MGIVLVSQLFYVDTTPQTDLPIYVKCTYKSDILTEIGLGAGSWDTRDE